MTNRGQLYILSGPSGSGKDTLLKVILSEMENVKLSISSVTRPMRQGEIDGEKYDFISRDAFKKLIADDALLEYNVYLGNYYGTPKAPVEKYLSQGIDVILEIDVNGAKNIKAKCPEAISVFITPPSFEILKARLSNRGTESPDVIAERLKVAVGEIAHAYEYDYIVINNDLKEACREFESIIIANRCNKNKRINLVKEFSIC